jgi:hypothetical protein
MRGRLLIFCGIPGSGKTTVARLVADSVKDSILVQTDGVRGMLRHPSFSGPESRFVYDACFDIAKAALRSGYLVILDGTFMKEDYRLEARRRLKKHYSRVDTVWVACGLETAMKRNSRRPSPVPPEKVKGMYLGFQPPRRAVKVDTSRLSAEVAASRVTRALHLNK